MKNTKSKMHCDEVEMTMNTTAVYGALPCLLCLKGEYAGYEIPILSTGLLIGRDTTACHLIFNQTPDISRYHCRVTYSGHTGYFVITDLHSLNGVYTEDDKRIKAGDKLVLGPGQIFKLCGEQVIFQTIVQPKQE